MQLLTRNQRRHPKSASTSQMITLSNRLTHYAEAYAIASTSKTIKQIKQRLEERMESTAALMEELNKKGQD